MDEETADQHEIFLTLFTANEAAIRAFVRRLVPTRQDTEDVMQGIALVLWRKFHELDDRKSFRRWAFGVARYESLAWLRDKCRDRHVLSEDVLDLVADESTRCEAWLQAQRHALDECLEKLPQPQRGLVLAAYAPQAEIQRVAKQSGRTVGAFYQWLHRIRLQLLECTRRTLQSEGCHE
ncbi:ECF RNA polymerase sigma factor RpoE [Rubripirellula lacrimiformis]|uniref:ECF RNA polymerase sigma factor RpoE n=1 Tax=Rubripirellula lacrimiformis TaxID=1930273 RepID=A0A517NJT2_9BACT|nr:sigma-70 family RNA polymerase sigma factor [Rubripirellula lacrimiformis]QDT07389.1 ECF RNA polymerase sigma factor RpoE [Rubripirellula lacrimiformis]